MHWLLVRLLRAAPASVPVADLRTVLDEHVTAEALATEADSFTPRSRSRPYGWGWAAASPGGADGYPATSFSARKSVMSAAIVAGCSNIMPWLPSKVSTRSVGWSRAMSSSSASTPRRVAAIRSANIS